MDVDPEILANLKETLGLKIVAIDQMVRHAVRCEEFHFSRLVSVIRERYLQQMRHAEKLVDRLLLLTERQPAAGTLQLSADCIRRQLESDLRLTTDIVTLCQHAIQVAQERDDEVSLDLFDRMLHEEAAHMRWIQDELELMEGLGVEAYISTIAKKSSEPNTAPVDGASDPPAEFTREKVKSRD